MSRISITAENLAVQAIVVPATTYYLSLHTDDPGTTGANEVTGGSYARQAVTFGSAAIGVSYSTNLQSFTGMPAESGGVPYFGIWTASTSGTYLFGGLTTNVGTSFPAGATVSFAIGLISVQIS